MAKAKSRTKKTVSKNNSMGSASLIAAASILFAGTAVVLLGNIQGQDNIKLLLVGFGAALLVLGGVLLGAAAKLTNK